MNIKVSWFDLVLQYRNNILIKSFHKLKGCDAERIDLKNSDNRSGIFAL